MGSMLAHGIFQYCQSLNNMRISIDLGKHE